LEGYYPKALELTRRVLELDPLYLIARENEINILLNLGEIDLAKSSLNALIKDYPQNNSYRQLSIKINTES
jgi:tetratricopeptide (TPR) repeat protein